MRAAYRLVDYLDLPLASALEQWRSIRGRTLPAPGENQVDYVPVETILCLAAMYLVDGTRFGSSTAHKAPRPVPELARLFARRPTSITSKMSNLDGARPRGGRLDRLVAAELRSDGERFAVVYRTVLAAARSAGIGADELPDFLGIEHGGRIALLGQDELGDDALGTVVEQSVASFVAAGFDERETERIVVGQVRVGQHRFAHDVLTNCGSRCVFCGFAAPSAGASHLLRASHVKPWRDSTSRERLHVANGVAACPTHDAAFDAGLMTIDDDLTIRLAPGLAADRDRSPEVWQFFGSPPLRAAIVLPPESVPVDVVYSAWHRERVFSVR